MRACVTWVLIGAPVCLAGGPALAQAPPYITEQVSFPSSGGLRIGALLGRPPGSGVFPASIAKGYPIFVPDAVGFLDAQLSKR